jgi:hypothetical protein
LVVDTHGAELAMRVPADRFAAFNVFIADVNLVHGCNRGTWTSGEGVHARLQIDPDGRLKYFRGAASWVCSRALEPKSAGDFFSHCRQIARPSRNGAEIRITPNGR